MILRFVMLYGVRETCSLLPLLSLSLPLAFDISGSAGVIRFKL